MATTTTPVLNPDTVERWIELSALELLLIGPFRDLFEKHLNAVEVEELDIVPSDGGLSLNEAWKAADRGDATEHDLLRHARTELLVATLLSELTPRRVTEAADFYRTLATSHLRQLHEMRAAEEAS